MTRRLLVLALSIVAVMASSCTLLASRERVDPRTDLPGARRFDVAVDELPGAVPAGAADVRGAWFFRERLADVQMEVGREPWLFYAVWIWLGQDGAYDLVYQAYWGSRGRSDPGFGGVDVRETGRFSIAAGVVQFEPQVTNAVEIRRGRRMRRTLDNDARQYIARIDGAYLNLVGRCATYQVEPICRESRDVWISLRSTSQRSSDEIPEL